MSVRMAISTIGITIPVAAVADMAPLGHRRCSGGEGDEEDSAEAPMSSDLRWWLEVGHSAARLSLAASRKNILATGWMLLASSCRRKGTAG